MSEDTMILECQACGHIWAERFCLPMAIDAMTARFKAMDVCPACGKKRKVQILLGDRYREAAGMLGVPPTGGEYGVPVPQKT